MRISTVWEGSWEKRIKDKATHVAMSSPFPKHCIYEAKCHGLTFPSYFLIFFPLQNHSLCCFQNSMQPCGCPVWLSDAKFLFQVSNLLPHVQKPPVYSILSMSCFRKPSIMQIHQLPPKHAQSAASENS